jgi:DNA replication protein DnaC
VTNHAELAHVLRAMKAPPAARAVDKLADRARQEEWCYERFVEPLLSTEISSRESSGGRSRIRAARFPAQLTASAFSGCQHQRRWRRGQDGTQLTSARAAETAGYAGSR